MIEEIKKEFLQQIWKAKQMDEIWQNLLIAILSTILFFGILWFSFYYADVLRITVWNERHWYDAPYNITCIIVVFALLAIMIWRWIEVFE